MSTKISKTDTRTYAPAGAPRPPHSTHEPQPKEPASGDALIAPRETLHEPSKAPTSPAPPPPKPRAAAAQTNTVTAPPAPPGTDTGVEDAKNRALRYYPNASPDNQAKARGVLAGIPPPE
jgi:hypothetical protein